MDVADKNYEFTGSIKTTCMVLILLAIVSFGMSFGMDKTVGAVDLIVGSLFITFMSVSGIFFLALSGVIQASWLTPYKRIPESMALFIPVAGVILGIAFILGLGTVYEWTHKEIVAVDPILQAKTAWLNIPRFLITYAIIFIIWAVLAWGHRRWSDKLESNNNEAAAGKYVGYSAITLILFGLTICTAAFDWVMSVEPHWFSTIFGIYIFAGSFVSGIAFITLTIIHLKSKGYMNGVINENHYHDLGKWMFGMSVFWAYIWISQYLLIWYANVPEETEYFVLRHHHWNFVFWANFALNFVFPFFALMTRGAKRNPKVLKFVASVLLFSHFLDMYLMVAPKVFEHSNIHSVSGYGVIQFLQFLGMLGVFTFIVYRALASRSLVPKKDLTFEEGCHLHQ